MPNGILKLMKIDNYSHVLEGLNNAKERVGSMAALARLANVDPTNLTRWMTGARSPSCREDGRNQKATARARKKGRRKVYP